MKQCRPWIDVSGSPGTFFVSLCIGGHRTGKKPLERHSVETRAGLALALLLYTGQHRSDVVRMGQQHVKGGRILVRQQKTGRPLAIPINPELTRALAAGPKTNMTFLVTEHGASFSAAGFGNWFRRVCDAARLSGCSAHGLRHAAGRRLAEAGAATRADLGGAGS